MKYDLGKRILWAFLPASILNCLQTVRGSSSTTPVVVMHGLFSSSKIPHTKHLRQLVESELGVYTTSVDLYKGLKENVYSYTTKMQDQVDQFNKRIREDAMLRNGFNAIGVSQGALLVRAYVQQYNDPPVLNFMSVHGPLGGFVSIPKCDIEEVYCNDLLRSLTRGIYTDYVQEHIAPSNYFRDPQRLQAYRKYGTFLADLNNEKDQGFNSTYRDKFTQLHSLALVRATNDTIVHPSESEWFGAYDEVNGSTVLRTFRETEWYINDSFGLQTLDTAGKISFYETEGEHVVISDDMIKTLLHKHFDNEVKTNQGRIRH